MNYYFDAPTDETTNWNERLVYSEDMIIKEHREYFINESDALVFETIDDDLIREQVIADWIVGCWAAPTDMPVGRYITANIWRI